MGKNRVVGRCRLCGNQEKLCDSHIIPEFFYKRLYDDLHKCLEVTIAAPSKSITHQKGLREPLLCECCDNKRLGKYEDYMARTLYGKQGISGKRIRNGILVEGLSYDRARLFQLSMLWRASISSLPEFGEVSLGPHEEKIRALLWDAEPGEPDQYPCVLCVPDRYFKALGDKAIKFPQVQKRHGHTWYDFYCGGLGWMYIVSSHTKGKLGRNMTIDLEGNLPVLFT